GNARNVGVRRAGCRVRVQEPGRWRPWGQDGPDSYGTGAGQLAFDPAEQAGASLSAVLCPSFQLRSDKRGQALDLGQRRRRKAPGHRAFLVVAVMAEEVPLVLDSAFL